jgi:hypothetical protein
MQQWIGQLRAVFALTAAGLALALVYAGGLPRPGSLDGLLRYPRAERVSPTRLSFQYLSSPRVTQSAAYQTTDDLARIHGWYARFLNPEQHEPPGAQAGCLALTRLSQYLVLRLAFAVHLCAQPGGTLIIFQRSLALGLP